MREARGSCNNGATATLSFLSLFQDLFHEHVDLMVRHSLPGKRSQNVRSFGGATVIVGLRLEEGAPLQDERVAALHQIAGKLGLLPSGLLSGDLGLNPNRAPPRFRPNL